MRRFLYGRFLRPAVSVLRPAVYGRFLRPAVSVLRPAVYGRQNYPRAALRAYFSPTLYRPRLRPILLRAVFVPCRLRAGRIFLAPRCGRIFRRRCYRPRLRPILLRAVFAPFCAAAHGALLRRLICGRQSFSAPCPCRAAEFLSIIAHRRQKGKAICRQNLFRPKTPPSAHKTYSLFSQRGGVLHGTHRRKKYF